MSKPLRALIIEDSADDTELMLIELRRGGYQVEHHQVYTREAVAQALKEQDWDVILCDHSLPQFDSMQALSLVHDLKVDIPFIVVSGKIGEEFAVNCMRAGCHDFVVKNNLSRLMPAVERELQEARVRQAHRQAEFALIESETRFRMLFDEAPVGYHELDREGRIVRVNRTELDMLGYSEEEMLGRFVWEFVIDPETSKQATLSKLGGHQHVQKALERTYCRKDGSHLPVLIEDRLLYDPQGEIVGVRTTLQDITQLKKSQEELRFQAMLLDQIRDLITATDLDGKIVYVNAAEARLLKRPKDQIIGQSIDLYSVDTAEGTTQEEIVKKTLANDFWQGEVVNRDAHGNKIYVDCRTWVMRDENGNPTGLCGIATDITQRIQAEQVRRQLAAIVESSEDAILSLSLDGVIQNWNSGARKVYGFDSTEAIGQPISLLIPPELKQESEFILNQIRRGEAIKNFETQRLTRDGTRINVSLSLSPIKDAAGRPIGSAVIARDITERIAGEEHQRKLEAHLRQAQKLESLGVLARGIAHDFNNLLTVISGNAEFLRRTLQLEVSDATALRDIENAARQAADMTRALQSFGRPTQPITRKLNLNDLITDVHRLLRRAIPTTIEFNYRLAGYPCMIEADAGQIQQVLINLCLNARDAMPEGGHLELITECISSQQLPEQPTAKRLADRYVAIHVRDEGVGMDEETMQKVFDPFFTTKPIDRGTGLGLAIVYQIVESHHGIIQVESKVGQGTHFRVYFPAVSEPVGDNSEESPEASASERIIVIEDEDMVASLIRTMLENRGYDVSMAGDSETAFNLIREKATKPFDLAIIDYTMAHISGEQCLLKLRRHQPGLRAILITGQDISEDDIALPGCRIVHKPFTIPAMGQAVRQMLDQKF